VDEDENSVCRFCLEDEETFWHLATDCPVFWRERNDAFGCNDITKTWDFNMIMNFAENLKIAKALEGDENIYFGDEGEKDGYQDRPPPGPD
jgi:hypothetical protein